MKQTSAFLLATSIVLWALAPPSVAATYDYSGSVTFCTTTCNGYAWMGGPGGSSNTQPSEISGSVEIDVQPGAAFTSEDIVVLDLEMFNPAIPIELYDGSNPTSANPFPLVGVASGSGMVDDNGQLVSGELSVTLTVPPLSSNGSVYYFDLEDGSMQGFLFDNIVLFQQAAGQFTLRPPPDTDGDGVADTQDNCVLVANALQRDSNADGFGNLCDADLDDDCQTNATDLGIFRQAFFGTHPDADLNGDGIVNPIDLGILRSLFFAAPGPSALTSCP